MTAKSKTNLPLGKAVQVDSMKPKLKPPGTKRSKLKCDILLSIYALEFILRRYTRELGTSPSTHRSAWRSTW